MKHALIVAAMLTVALTACGKKEEAAPPAPPAPAAAPAEPAPAPPAAAPTEPAAGAPAAEGQSKEEKKD